MAKGYRPVDRDQVFLSPPNLRDWLPAGHRVWFILDVVDTLDLSEFHKASKLGGVGRAGYDSQVLLAGDGVELLDAQDRGVGDLVRGSVASS